MTPELIEATRARIDRFDVRRLAPFVLMGTASDRYAGWIGQIYPEAYRERIRGRSRKLGGRSYREETVPIDSVAHYFEHFDVLELDFTFYRPLLEPDGRPGSNLNVLRNYADSAPDHARFLLKAPQAYFVRNLRRGGQKPLYESNPDYLDAEACLKNFIDPALRVLGHRLGGVIFEQSFVKKSESPTCARNVQELGKFFSSLDGLVQGHVELRSPHLLDDGYFAWLREAGIGFVFSHWSWLPPIRDQWKMAGEQFSAADHTAVTRLLTPLRISYADAYANTHPFDRTRAEIAESAGGHRMIMDATALALQGALQGYTIDVIANNRAWGNAPELAQTLARQILLQVEKRARSEGHSRP
jgi:uncharacterized protein YecE (DUF72 family)